VNARPLIQEVQTAHTPESLVESLGGAAGLVLLRSALFESGQARYSFVAAEPFLIFRSSGSQCEITHHASRITSQVQFGNPWHLLDALMSRYELLDEIDLPFPLGGCFGYWGYDLKNFVEPKLPRRAVNDLDLPDCHVGFYDSLVVFDHQLGKVCVVSTGLAADGSRDERRAQQRAELWKFRLTGDEAKTFTPDLSLSERERENLASVRASACSSKSNFDSRTLFPLPRGGGAGQGEGVVHSSTTRPEFLAAVERAQRYIRAGDIYQVNLSHRLATSCALPGWELFARLLAVSPAPFAAFLDCGDFHLASSSPELFLRLSGPHITTRPIKGTRPRSPDATRDAQLAFELQTSPKELAELVMITDLLRNDLGKVSEFGSVQVPELAKLERFPQVQHLVSTVEGRLRRDQTHFSAFASCFPGGSITGAPKFRAMQIIDELEPLARGPYTGCHGYLGFNRESQLSISIRTAIRQADAAYFQVGAGIVADSVPEAEYEETLAKGLGFLASLGLPATRPNIAATSGSNRI
jgi:para-aminobenzoate synthetase component I